MHFSPPFYILVAAATVFCLVTGATVPRWCSSKKPEGSKCQGCPPMFDGKPCASTTRYNGRKWGDGSCACRDPWTKSKYTAAANAVFMNPLRKRVTAASAVDFCQENCGQCYRICTTGGSHTNSPNVANVCIVIQLENTCPPAGNAACRQTMSPEHCADHPTNCTSGAGEFGYPAHFDLQNADNQGVDSVNQKTLPVLLPSLLPSSFFEKDTCMNCHF